MEDTTQRPELLVTGSAPARPNPVGPDGRQGGGARHVVVLLLVFFVPGLVWTFASPVFSVPDEPDQAVKAVSIWFGQLDGERIPGEPGVVRTYEVPSAWATERTPPAVCYAFEPDVTPDRCDDHLFAGGSDRTAVRTYDGGFPPLYYALVGWGGRLSSSVTGLFLMRIISAALSAGFLAWAVVALRRVIAPPLALAAVLVATTPMTYFLSGSVNPNGFEAAAATSLWCHVVAVASGRGRRPDGSVPRALLVGVVVSGAALAFTRFLSPVFVAVIVVLGLASGAGPALRSIGRDRRSWAAFGGLAAIVGLALGFVLGSGNADGLGGGAVDPALDPWRTVAGMSSRFVLQMIGWFGWLDTPPTDLLVWLWLGAVALLVGLALLVGRRRELLVLATTVVLTVAIPVLVQAPRLIEFGLTWQGRHGLPIAVGIPILAAAIIGARARDHTDPDAEPDLRADVGPRRIGGLTGRTGLVARTAVIATVAVAVANVQAVWWALHRYTLGANDARWDLAAGAWQPPLGSWTWVVVMVLWAVGVVVLVGSASAGAVPVAPPPGRPVPAGRSRGSMPAPVVPDLVGRVTPPAP